MNKINEFNRGLIYSILFILAVLALLAIIQRRHDISFVQGKSLKNYEFCSRLPRIKVDIGREPALVIEYKLQWRSKRPLNVYFFGNNHPALIKRIISTANEWSTYCGIRFKETSTITDSHIRVTFTEGGYASAVGIEAIQLPYKEKATMCLQGLDTLSDENEFRRVVLHEFGHGLGLEHELQSPAAKIPWDTAALYKYYLDRYGWQPDSVMNHILNKLTNVYYTGFDSTSIMVYAVPDTLTIGKYEIRWPNTLSNTDRRQIGVWYSK